MGGSASPLPNGTQLDTITPKLDGRSGTARIASKTYARTSAVRDERHRAQTYKEVAVMCEAVRLSGDAAKHL